MTRGRGIMVALFSLALYSFLIANWPTLAHILYGLAAVTFGIILGINLVYKTRDGTYTSKEAAPQWIVAFILVILAIWQFTK